MNEYDCPEYLLSIKYEVFEDTRLFEEYIHEGYYWWVSANIGRVGYIKVY